MLLNIMLSFSCISLSHIIIKLLKTVTYSTTKNKIFREKNNAIYYFGVLDMISSGIKPMEILKDIDIVVIHQHNIIISVSVSETPDTLYIFDIKAGVNKCHEFIWPTDRKYIIYILGFYKFSYVII